ncbi:MAG: YraN family protein [Proteobacteria bacterium]|nr:YraN family protein [Pseudomonadota bacterium]
MSSLTTGQQAEREAEAFLRSEKFSIIERNFRTRYGEIDLIAEQGRLLVFVEVRMRNNPRFGSGADSVTPAKQRRIINSAEQFLKIHGTRRWDDYRFDVISMSDVSGEHRGSDLDWIPGAFTLD